MTQFTMPESVHTYMNDDAVRTAVDHLLDKKPSYLPDNLTWKEVPDYYRAYLSAQQVRVEFALMLHELWEKVWQPVIGASPVFSKMDEIAPSKLVDEGWEGLSLATIWNDESAVTHIFRQGGVEYGLGIGFDGIYKNGLRLYVCVHNTKLGENLFEPVFGGDWEAEPHLESWRVTQPKLAEINSPLIDLSKLIHAAKMAIGSLEG